MTLAVKNLFCFTENHARIGIVDVLNDSCYLGVNFKQFFYESIFTGKNHSSRNKNNHNFTAFEASFNEHVTQKSRVSVLVISCHAIFRHH